MLKNLYKQKKSIIVALFFMLFAYTLSSNYMYGKTIIPPIASLHNTYDLLTEEEIEQSKKTSLEWLFWDKNSYVEYKFLQGKYIDIKLGGALFKITKAKLLFGKDGVYNGTSIDYTLKSQSHNACKIPSGKYNCVKIYPVGSVFDHQDLGKSLAKEDITQYLVIKSITTSYGVPGACTLYLTTILLWSVMFVLFNIVEYRQESCFFDKEWKYKYIVGTVIIFAFFIILKECYYPYNKISYWADASVYYGNADTFIKDGVFSLHNYLWTDTDKTFRFRGVLLPLFIYIMKLPGKLLNFNSDLSYEIFSNLFFSIFFAAGIPELWKTIFNKEVKLYQIFFPPILFVLFLRGLLVTPMSDLYAAVFATYFIVFLLKMMQCENIKIRLIYGILCGTSFYLAYNIRAANILLGMALIIFIIQKWKSPYTIIQGCLFVFAGMLPFSLIQTQVNCNLCNITSPFVLTNEYTKGHGGLLIMQLMEGLQKYRYEAELAVGSEMTRSYINPTGKILYLKYVNNVNNLGDFFKLCMHYPFTVAIIWFTHVIVAMDLRFPDISNIQLIHLNFLMFVCTILFWSFTLMTFISQNKEKISSTITPKKTRNDAFLKVIIEKIKGKKMWLVILSLPALAQVLGMFETRFATQLYLLVFMAVSYGFEKDKMINLVRKHPLRYLGAIALLGLFLGMVWNMAYSYPSFGNIPVLE